MRRSFYAEAPTRALLSARFAYCQAPIGRVTGLASGRANRFTADSGENLRAFDAATRLEF